MPHDHQPQGRLILQKTLRPAPLLFRSVIQRCLVLSMVPQRWAQEINQAKAQVGVKQSVDGCSGSVLNHSMNQLCLPAALGEPVTMDGENFSSSDLEGCTHGLEIQTQVPFPELAVPPVVISSHHYYWHVVAQAGQRGGNMESVAGYDAGVGKPEVEEIAIYEQAIAHRGACPQKLQQHLLCGRRRHSQVGIGHDDEAVAQHAAR